jgi:hypothetical protein
VVNLWTGKRYSRNPEAPSRTKARQSSEYDFSHGEAGKHYARPDAVFHIPVYLDQDVQTSAIREGMRGFQRESNRRLGSLV